MKTNKLVLAGALMTAVLMGDISQAVAKSAGDVLMRVRGIGFFTDTDGTTDAFGGEAWTSDDVVPEVDFYYFITDNIAAELILATTDHNVKVKDSTGGVLNLGRVRALPPTLTLQYHFRPKEDFSPYIGAGVNYTITYKASAGSSVNDVKYSDEFGYAFQIGFDYKLTDRLSFNFDIKKVFVDTDIVANGGAVNALGTDLDPTIFGVGFGYKF